MNRVRRFLYNADINRFRFYFQIAAFAFLLYGGYLALDMTNSLPTFACPFTESRSATCYLYPLQHQFHMPLSQFLGGRGIGLLTGFITFLLFFVFLNKAWCGYVCPLGTLQDWISKLRTKLGVRYSTYLEASFRKLKKVKYVLLVLLILLSLGMSNAIPGMQRLSEDFGTAFCMVCPGRTVLPLFTGDIKQLVVDFSSKTKLVLTALGMAATGVFFAGAFVKRRFFCLFCPMSALHYLFMRIGLLRLTKEGAKCTKCGNCYRVCDVGIREIADDVTRKNIVQDDCMMCFKCVAVCPEEKCLNVAFLGLPVYRSTEEGFHRRTQRRTMHGE